MQFEFDRALQEVDVCEWNPQPNEKIFVSELTGAEFAEYERIRDSFFRGNERDRNEAYARIAVRFAKNAAGVSSLFSSVIDSNKNESQRIQEQIDIVKASISQGIDPDGKAQQVLSILEDKSNKLSATYVAEQEAEKVLRSSLTGTATEVNKVKEQFGFLSKVTDKEIEKSTTLSSARAEYEKKLRALTPEGQKEVKDEEQKKSITTAYEGTLTAEAKYAKRKGELTGMLDKAFIQTPAWLAAMEENKKSLLSGSKFGKYLSDAREQLNPLSEKLATAFSEIDNVGKELGYSAKEIEEAKSKAKKELSGDKNADKGTQSDNLVAATRGSVVAYKVAINLANTGWQWEILDAGKMQKYDRLTETNKRVVDIEPILDAKGAEVSDPQPLNGSGYLLPKGASPVYLKFRKRYEADFNSLAIPNPFLI